MERKIFFEDARTNVLEFFSAEFPEMQLDAVDGFTGADSCFVIGERVDGIIVIQVAVVVHACHFAEGVALQLSALPRQ